jgi:acyl-CoA dehydrogenase
MTSPADSGLEEFIASAYAFLEATLPPRLTVEFAWGKGTDAIEDVAVKSRAGELEDLAVVRDYCRRRFDAGFGWITGPRAYGGRALSPRHQHEFDELEQGYAVPELRMLTIGLGMIAPTILAHGSEYAKGEYLAALYRADILACQLFSEPGAGSDLAGLGTTAVQDGDSWVISGQKVWTSGAHYSQIGEVIARTDPQAPKHKGLTAFLIPMDAPGVEIRPLKQMNGGTKFNEVFLTDVRVPDGLRLGDVNNGWNVALTTLMNERATISIRGGGPGNELLKRLIEMVRHFGLQDDPVTAQRLADAYIHQRVTDYFTLSAAERSSAGAAPGPEMSIGKLSAALQMDRVMQVGSSILGSRATADTGEWGTYSWSDVTLISPSLHIAGGTDEIMRNILAERVLGLPK